MLEKQRESAETRDHVAKLADRVGYGSFIPRWYEREVAANRASWLAIAGAIFMPTNTRSRGKE